MTHAVTVNKDTDPYSPYKWIARCSCGWKEYANSRDKANKLRRRHTAPHPAIDLGHEITWKWEQWRFNIICSCGWKEVKESQEERLAVIEEHLNTVLVRP